MAKPARKRTPVKTALVIDGLTYQITRHVGQCNDVSYRIHCKRCSNVSSIDADIKMRYCPHCHKYHES